MTQKSKRRLKNIVVREILVDMEYRKKGYTSQFHSPSCLYAFLQILLLNFHLFYFSFGHLVIYLCFYFLYCSWCCEPPCHRTLFSNLVLTVKVYLSSDNFLWTYSPLLFFMESLKLSFLTLHIHRLKMSTGALIKAVVGFHVYFSVYRYFEIHGISYLLEMLIWFIIRGFFHIVKFLDFGKVCVERLNSGGHH